MPAFSSLGAFVAEQTNAPRIGIEIHGGFPLA
jgi:hypothetical protein